MYHLPLLPGYGPNTNLRSSAPAPVTQGSSYLAALSEAEENGYQGSYFTQPARRSSVYTRDGYISSTSPVEARKIHSTSRPQEPLLRLGSDTNSEDVGDTTMLSETEAWTDGESATNSKTRGPQKTTVAPSVSEPSVDDVAEIVFFDYGVVVFFGLTEQQEKDVLEDIENAGIMKRKVNEGDWEVEECHFAVCSMSLLK